MQLRADLTDDKLVKYNTPYGDVYIDAEHPIAAIKLSGGWDSAVLCYLIAHANQKFDLKIKIQQLTVNRRNLTPNRMLNRVNNGIVATNVELFVKEHFQKQQFIFNIILDADYWWCENIKKENSYLYQQRTAEAWALKQASENNYNISLYSGTTLNPPPGSIEDSPETHRDCKLDTIENSAGVVRYFDYEKIKLKDIEPFRNADKRITMWLAHQLGITDDLKRITRSCEGDTFLTKNFTQDCMQCWWCKEKHWALENYEKDK